MQTFQHHYDYSQLHRLQCFRAGLEALCDLLCCGRVTIWVTRVSAASRAAVSSVMSGKSMSMSRDGAVVVGKYHSIEEITSAIITAAKHCQIPLFFSRGGPIWLVQRNQRAEAVICEVTLVCRPERQSR